MLRWRPALVVLVPGVVLFESWLRLERPQSDGLRLVLLLGAGAAHGAPPRARATPGVFAGPDLPRRDRPGPRPPPPPVARRATPLERVPGLLRRPAAADPCVPSGDARSAAARGVLLHRRR